MELQGYSFDVTYKQGKKNIADYISCIHNNKPAPEIEVMNHYVNFVVNNSVPFAMLLEEIKVKI